MSNRLYLCQLLKGDILLKIIPEKNAAFISKAIGYGQRSHLKIHAGGSYTDFKKNLGFDPCSYSHAALALGDNKIMEFDEGSGIAEIMKFKGEGVIFDTDKSKVNRTGNQYTVIRCLHNSLPYMAWRKALMIQSYASASSSASYGIRKLVSSSLLHKRGDEMDAKKIEKLMSKLRGERVGVMGMRRANMFCSEFVTTCYLWAALDLSYTGAIEPLSLLGTMKTRLCPAELSVRLLTYGANHFVSVGTYHG